VKPDAGRKVETMTNTDDPHTNADAVEPASMRARRAIADADERARENDDDTIEAALARDAERAR